MKFFSSFAGAFLVALLFGACLAAAEPLTGDSSPLAVQNGSDLILNGTGNGPLEVILGEDDQLLFEVCPQSCDAQVLLCFEGDVVNSNSTLTTEQCESKCGLLIDGSDDDQIDFMKTVDKDSEMKSEYPPCLLVPMVQGQTNISNADSNAKVEEAQTCKPKIEEGGFVKLIAKNVSSRCPVLIKNASLKIDPTTTMTPSTTGTQNTTTAATEAPSFFSLYWWVIPLVALLVLLVGGALIGAYVFLSRKVKKQNDQKKLNQPPSKQEKIDSVLLPPSQRSALFSTKDGLPEHYSDLQSVKVEAAKPEAEAAKK